MQCAPPVLNCHVIKLSNASLNFPHITRCTGEKPDLFIDGYCLFSFKRAVALTCIDRERISWTNAISFAFYFLDEQRTSFFGPPPTWIIFQVTMTCRILSKLVPCQAKFPRIYFIFISGIYVTRFLSSFLVTGRYFHCKSLTDRKLHPCSKNISKCPLCLKLSASRYPSQNILNSSKNACKPVCYLKMPLNYILYKSMLL